MTSWKFSTVMEFVARDYEFLRGDYFFTSLQTEAEKT